MMSMVMNKKNLKQGISCLLHKYYTGKKVYIKNVLTLRNQKQGHLNAILYSDVPGPAWAQTPALGWALAGLGFSKLKPGPELRTWLGLGLVGLKPGLVPKW